MSLTTITITGASIGAKTLPAPELINAYGQSVITEHVPIDGETILDISPNRDSYGDKNAVRGMSWGALPASGINWTMTLTELKSLEGTNAVLDATSCSSYTTTQNIKIHHVNLDFIHISGSDELYSVEVTYSHR